MFRRRKKEVSGVLYIAPGSFGQEAELYLAAEEHPEDIGKRRYATFEVRVLDKDSSQK